MKKMIKLRIVVSILIFINAGLVGENMCGGFLERLLIVPLCLLCSYLPFTFKEEV